MKILLGYCLIICFVLSVNRAYSQGTGNYVKDSIDIARVPQMQISLDTNNDLQINTVAFKSIRVEDVRFDTTHIGIYSMVTSGFVSSMLNNYKINLKDGLGNSFSNYLNQGFRILPGGEDREVVCFIKSLSVVRRDTMVENNSMFKKYGKMNFTVEVFLRSGNNFYAAFKIDTVLYSLINIKKKQIGDDMEEYLLMPALQLLKNHITQTDWEDIATRKAFTEDFVDEHYLKDRFKIPVLSQPCKKGIYRTFTEFRNNAPSIENFKVEKEKFKTILLSDGKGNLIPTTKLFGFCDGEKYWILMGNYPFPMVRVGNGFEFFLTIDKRIKLLLALDMEKGNVY